MALAEEGPAQSEGNTLVSATRLHLDIARTLAWAEFATKDNLLQGIRPSTSTQVAVYLLELRHIQQSCGQRPEDDLHTGPKESALCFRDGQIIASDRMDAPAVTNTASLVNLQEIEPTLAETLCKCDVTCI